MVFWQAAIVSRNIKKHFYRKIFDLNRWPQTATDQNLARTANLLATNHTDNTFGESNTWHHWGVTTYEICKKVMISNGVTNETRYNQSFWFRFQTESLNGWGLPADSGMDVGCCWW
jgi:hypothetical protein